MPPRQARRFPRRKVLAIAGIGALTTGMMCVGASSWLGNLWNNLNAASDDIYAGQNGPVYSVDCNGGVLIASASSDKTVQVINLDGDGDPDSYGNRPPSFYASTNHKGAVNSVSWSPDREHFASASTDGTVQVSQVFLEPTVGIVMSGKEVLTYTGHTAAVQAVAWSPDGTKIVSASVDGCVQVWNAQTGKMLTSKNQAGALYAIAWSPSGKLIAFGGTQKIVLVWNLTDGHILSTYRGHTGPISGLVWSPKSDAQIASASSDGTVRIWNVSDGSHALTYAGHTAAVRGVDWFPDGGQMASASADGSVQIWNATNASPIYIYRRHSAAVNTVAWIEGFNMFVPGIVGSWIASGSDDKTVRIWKVGEAGSDVKSMRIWNSNEY